MSDEADTVPMCISCGGETIRGGPIVPDEAMVRNRWTWCAFGSGWSWCYAARRFTRAER